MEEGCIRLESKSSPEEVEPVTAFTTKRAPQVSKLIDSAVAFFAEHDTDPMRSSKVQREIQNALKCYMVVYNQKLKTATQVSIKRLFKKQPSSSTSAFHKGLQLQLESPTDLKKSCRVTSTFTCITIVI
jgi:hypothetical protein